MGIAPAATGRMVEVQIDRTKTQPGTMASCGDSATNANSMLINKRFESTQKPAPPAAKRSVMQKVQAFIVEAKKSVRNLFHGMIANHNKSEPPASLRTSGDAADTDMRKSLDAVFSDPPEQKNVRTRINFDERVSFDFSELDAMPEEQEGDAKAAIEGK